MKAATYAAEKCGTLFASAADGDAIATGRWAIDGDTFDAAVGLDGQLGAAARGRNAQKLKPLVRKLLTTKPIGYTTGTDMLGGFDAAGRCSAGNNAGPGEAEADRARHRWRARRARSVLDVRDAVGLATSPREVPRAAPA